MISLLKSDTDQRDWLSWMNLSVFYSSLQECQAVLDMCLEKRIKKRGGGGGALQTMILECVAGIFDGQATAFCPAGMST